MLWAVSDAVIVGAHLAHYGSIRILAIVTDILVRASRTAESMRLAAMECCVSVWVLLADADSSESKTPQLVHGLATSS